MKTRPNTQFLNQVLDYWQHDKENIENFQVSISSACTSASMKKKKWRRKRKNNDQVNILIEEYNRNSTWTKDQVVYLAKKSGLSEAQVYKWGWDYKKKLRKQALQYNVDEIMCKEIIAPSKIDLEMMSLQRNYKESYSGINAIVPMQLFL
jgi:formylmethanofuran dehydrogenase subunit B